VCAQRCSGERSFHSNVYNARCGQSGISILDLSRVKVGRSSLSIRAQQVSTMCAITSSLNVDSGSMLLYDRYVVNFILPALPLDYACSEGI